MEQRLLDLEQRLRQTERRVRLLSLAALILVVCSILALTSKPAATQAGAARSSEHIVHAPFKVVDAAGKMIMDVEDAREAEGHYLRLFDTKGNLMVHIGMNMDGGEVSVYSPSAWATMMADSDSARVTLKGKSAGSASTAQIVGSPKGGALWLYDKAGKNVIFENPAGSAPK